MSSGLLSLKGENSPVGELTTMRHEPSWVRLVAMYALTAASALACGAMQFGSLSCTPVGCSID